MSLKIWLLALYLIPLVVNYIYARKEINELDLKPDWQYMIIVFVPAINIFFTLIILSEIISLPRFIKYTIPQKVFMVKKKGGKK